MILESIFCRGQADYSLNHFIYVSGPKQQYLPQILREKGLSRGKWERMVDLHALPEGGESLEYQEFPEQRRSLMAGIIGRGFEAI